MSTSSSVFILRLGAVDCASAKCGHDAGCRLEPDGGYVCVCPHDLSIKVAGRPCTRIVGKCLVIVTTHFSFALENRVSAALHFFFKYLSHVFPAKDEAVKREGGGKSR